MYVQPLYLHCEQAPDGQASQLASTGCGLTPVMTATGVDLQKNGLFVHVFKFVPSLSW